MATFKKFEDIEAWKKARALTRKIYSASNQAHFARDFGLRDQIRRSAVSVISNIAEGYDRNGTGEFIQFLAIAKDSAAEVQSQLYVAFDQTYIDRQEFEELKGLASETGANDRRANELSTQLTIQTKYKKSISK